MGTHPIFESDFDCLTENRNMKLVPLLIAAATAHEHAHADGKSKWTREANEAHDAAQADDHGHAHDHGHGHGHDCGAHGHSHNGMDMQPPTKTTERWAGKSQYHAEETLEDKIDVWFKALFATTLISAAPYFILFFVPVEKTTEETKPLLNILLAFASGGLLGDAFLHLIPHASHSHLPEADHGHSHDHGHAHEAESHGHSHSAEMAIGLNVLAGILAFMCVELFVRHVKGSHGHSHGGHGHSHGAKAKAVEEEKKEEKKDDKSDDEQSEKSEKSDEKTDESDDKKSVEKKEEKEPEQELAVAAWLNLAADFAHNFTDGMAIGASFLAGQNIGVITTLTILLHEVPHEIGDFAILIQSGATKERAMMLQLVTAMGAMLGTVVGLLLGGTFGAVSIILPFTAGGFIYIATVGVIPELLANEKATISQNIKEVGAMLVGIGLMVVIGWLE